MKLIILFFIFTMILKSQNVWEMTEWRAGGKIVKLDCIDSNNCFATTDNGRIFHSINQGKTWEIILDEKIIENGNYWINDSEFIDKNNYFLSNPQGILLKTSNGGITFDSIDFGRNMINDWIKMYDFENGIINSTYYTFDDTDHSIYKTSDSWNTFSEFNLWKNAEREYEYIYIRKPKLYQGKLITLFSVVSKDKIPGSAYIGKINSQNNYIESLTSKLPLPLFGDFEITNSYYFVSGSSDFLSGGTARDRILKYNNNKWYNVLDIYYSHQAFNVEEKYSKPWGIQSIAFKNDSIGIAVGQFGKIIYTYDAGESWYYEKELNNFIIEFTPPTMLVSYAGETPIIAEFNRYLFRMTEDNLAPKPQDTLVISGYVMFEGSPQAEIPVALDNRITMTDSNGYYRFIHIRPNKEFTLQVYNKYYNYRPFFYTPEKIQISTTKDTVINFEAIDNKKFHNISGNVYKDWEGLADIPVVSYNNRVYDTVYTNEDGFYHFENIEEGFNYSYKPISDEYKFEPEQYSFATTGDQTGYRFHASPISSVTQNPNFQIRDNVLISEEVAGMNYRIISLSGRVVKSGILPKELNLNANPTGTYILQITKSEQVIFTHKFQVVR